MSNPPAGGDPGSNRDPQAGTPDGMRHRFGAIRGSAVRLGAIGVAVLAMVLVLAAVLGGGTTMLTGTAAATGTIPPATASLEPSSGGSATPSPVAATPTPASPSPDRATPALPSSPPAPPEPTPTSSAAPSGDVPAAALQRRLDALRKKLSLPGVSVAVLWDDGRRWLGASGVADVKAKAPMTTGTGLALASISKTYTAAVVLQLVEEGKLGLDQPVAPLLPSFKLDRRITVRMLLDHTSGLPDYFLNPKIDRPLQANPGATWTADQVWAYVLKKRPVPGRSWAYSNANYLLLGQLVEKVTGRPISTEIRERLLDPLGLETTWYQAVETPRVKGAVGYRVLPKTGGGVRYVPVAPPSSVMPFRSVVTAADGAGSIAATALDAARWMQAYAGGSVLTPGMRQQQLRDVALTRKLHARIPYGLGIQALPVAGHRALGHSGRFLGFRNVARYLPDDGITIAVLTNQGVTDPARIAEAMLKIVLPPSNAPGASGSPSLAPVPPASPSASPAVLPSASPSASP